MFNTEILQEFIFGCRMRKLSERTAKSYNNNNLALFRFISTEYGIEELEETNHIAIRGYIEFLTKKGLSETYINSLLKCFKCYFNYCIQERYINRNPMDKVKKQKEAIPLNMISSQNYQREKGFQEGIVVEATRFATLVKRVMQDNRMEELQPIAETPELSEKYYDEYGI